MPLLLKDPKNSDNKDTFQQLFQFSVSTAFLMKNHNNKVLLTLNYSDVHHITDNICVIFLYNLHKNVQYIHQKGYLLLTMCYNYKQMK